MITDSDIKNIARLSNLEIAENEIESFKHDLEQVVNYVNTLSKIDTSGVDIKNQAVSLEELRLDEVKPSLSQNEAIKNAPKKRAGGFSVPAVIE